MLGFTQHLVFDEAELCSAANKVGNFSKGEVSPIRGRSNCNAIRFQNAMHFGAELCSASLKRDDSITG